MNKDAKPSFERGRSIDPGLDLVRTLISRWRLLLLVTVAVAVLGGLWSFLQPDRFRASVSILPGLDGGSVSLASTVASLTGVQLDTGNSYQELLPVIARSNAVLVPLLDRKWTRNGEPADLYEALGRPAREEYETRQDAQQALLAHLRKNVLSFEYDSFTGFLRLRVDIVEDAELAAALANAITDALDRFLVDLWRERAAEQEDFYAAKLLDVESELLAAETALREFQEGNRSYQSSPTLRLDFERLQREVAAITSIWIELRRQHEIARLDEARSTAKLVVLDRAEVPAKPVNTPIFVIVAVAGILGFAIAVLTLIAWQFWCQIAGINRHS